ncbi:hypothetical protein D3C86_1214020 [compost metagenome]
MRGDLDFFVTYFKRIDWIFVFVYFFVPRQDDFPIVRVKVHLYFVELVEQQVQEDAGLVLFF